MQKFIDMDNSEDGYGQVLTEGEILELCGYSSGDLVVDGEKEHLSFSQEDGKDKSGTEGPASEEITLSLASIEE